MPIVKTQTVMPLFAPTVQSTLGTSMASYYTCDLCRILTIANPQCVLEDVVQETEDNLKDDLVAMEARIDEKQQALNALMIDMKTMGYVYIIYESSMQLGTFQGGHALIDV